MELTPKQRKHLEALAHDMEPVVRIGKGGITPALVKTVGEALQARELIKVKILDNAEVEREEAADTLVEQTRCQLVRVIGRVLVLYRANPQRKRPIDLSAPARPEDPSDPDPAGWDGTPTPAGGDPRPAPGARKARPATGSGGPRPAGKRPPTRRSGGRRPGGARPEGRRFPPSRQAAKRGPGSRAPAKKPRIKRATPRSTTRRS
ncbi:MAG: ribosome assembly RNA-binding protein YhbY [Candidatus Riflebacteria bacterium]|nr:ribosome assembly RNA-binding protein YhbY [Candidatus Riflebacteria bacterium]